MDRRLIKITKRTHFGDSNFVITTITYDESASFQAEKRTHFNRDHAFENGDRARGGRAHLDLQIRAKL
jgi:hypothetical protein